MWCEFCRDHFDEDHYTYEGDHKIGHQYGPTGQEIEEKIKTRQQLEIAFHILNNPSHSDTYARTQTRSILRHMLYGTPYDE